MRIFSLIFIALFTITIPAQQTLFNVPSTDVLGKGKVYLELDAGFKTNDSPALQKFSSFVPRVVVGAGKGVEVGLNVLGNIQPGSDAIIFAPTAKWRFYNNEKKGTALVAGTNFYVPVRRAAYKFGTYSYLAVSKTINKTRITGGAFIYSRNVVAANAARGGGQFGLEQTLSSKLTLAADWITGKHANGYLTPGVFYKPHPKTTVYLGYSLGNARLSQGNHYFLFELGYNFN